MAYNLKLQKGDKVILFEKGKWIEGIVVTPNNVVDWVGIETYQKYGYKHCTFINNPKFNLEDHEEYRIIVIKKVS